MLTTMSSSSSSSITPLASFFIYLKKNFFYWSLNDSLRTFLSILADLNNALVCMVLILLISYSSGNLFKPLETVLTTSIKISITAIFMFHCFLSSLARSKYLLLLLLNNNNNNNNNNNPWKVFTSADDFSLEFESLQVSWILLRILADLNNVIVWMVDTRPVISKSSSP